MTKNQRQLAILDTIEKKEIHTQGELVQEILDLGFDVTQATISRDINELKLIKISSEDGKHKYATQDKATDKLSGRKLRIFYESVLSVKRLKNIIIITTLSGSANAAAETIDSLHWEGILGTIAGDNCIMVIIDEDSNGDEITEKFTNLLA